MTTRRSRPRRTNSNKATHVYKRRRHSMRRRMRHGHGPITRLPYQRSRTIQRRINTLAMTTIHGRHRRMSRSRSNTNYKNRRRRHTKGTQGHISRQKRRSRTTKRSGHLHQGLTIQRFTRALRNKQFKVLHRLMRVTSDQMSRQIGH